MIQQTSLWAYREVQTRISEHQQKVLDVIQHYPKVDNLMISQILHWPINSITPRVKELRDMGKVREAGKHRSALTGRTVMGWEVV